MTTFHMPEDKQTPVVARLAERLGVDEVPAGDPHRAIEYRANDGRRWDINELMMALLDRMDEAAALHGIRPSSADTRKEQSR
jgi:hypothetical protein